MTDGNIFEDRRSNKDFALEHYASEARRLQQELTALCGYARNISIGLSSGGTKAAAIKDLEALLKRAEHAQNGGGAQP